MTTNSHFSQLISLAENNHPGANFNDLVQAAYSRPLAPQEQRRYAQLIAFARVEQAKNPIYEPAFHQLLNLYVLNGSRLDMLSRLERRIRGLADGQASLVLISGSSGIGKTSLVMTSQQRTEQLGAGFFVARCSEQEGTP